MLGGRNRFISPSYPLEELGRYWHCLLPDGAVFFSHAFRSRRRMTPEPQRLDNSSGSPGPFVTILGTYRLIREIGHGGMGTVYLADRAGCPEQPRLALKVIRAEASGAAHPNRLYREARLLAALDHPNIARLIDAAATTDGQPYLVMEYIEGNPINEYCDARRLSVRDRLALFLQLSSAVDYLHTQRIVHRDLKPGNILVTEDRKVKLLDFGIARMFRPLGDETLTITATGLMMMTPAYASQALNRFDANRCHRLPISTRSASSFTNL